jgi:tight adherence protein C
MLTALSERVLDPQLMTSALIAIATAATIWTLAAPFLEGESLEKRMRAVAIERDRIRARERERMAKAQQKPSLRQQPKVYMRQVVDGF